MLLDFMCWHLMVSWMWFIVVMLDCGCGRDFLYGPIPARVHGNVFVYFGSLLLTEYFLLTFFWCTLVDSMIVNESSRK